jgi:hypothetical protein
MFSLTLLGGNRLDGSELEPGESLFCLVLFGGLELDFTSCAELPVADIVVVSLFGGATIKVRPEQHIRLSGFSLLGGRSVEPRRLPAPSNDAEPDDLPLELSAYALFGGVAVKREVGSRQ